MENIHQLCYTCPNNGGFMHSPNDNIFEIRDPVHTSIPFDIYERQVLDHPFVQRLRRIRQLGFAQYSFPGATHSRFSHSVGVMHLAGKAFDVIFRDRPFSTMKISSISLLCEDGCTVFMMWVMVPIPMLLICDAKTEYFTWF